MCSPLASVACASWSSRVPPPLSVRPPQSAAAVTSLNAALGPATPALTTLVCACAEGASARPANAIAASRLMTA